MVAATMKLPLEFYMNAAYTQKFLGCVTNSVFVIDNAFIQYSVVQKRNCFRRSKPK